MRRDSWQWPFLAVLVVGLCGVLLYGAFLIAFTYGVVSSDGKASPLPERLSMRNASRLGLVVILLLGPFFGQLTHELGHVLAGWLVGFRFQLLVVGPFKVVRGGSGRVRLELNRDLALFGGVAESLPTDSHDLVARFAWVVAGGPLMSLALAVAALLALALGPPGVGPLPRLAIAWWGLFCGLLGLAASIPIPLGRTFISDGLRLLRLLRGGAEAARDAAVLHLLGLASAKTPPRAWDDAVIAKALVPSDDSSFECAARLLAYKAAVDRGEGERAYEHLARALELRETYFESPAPLLAEAAYFEGWWRGRADEARRWLGQLPARSPYLPDYERLRAEAAAEAAAGETASAQARVEEALRLAPIEAVWTRDRLDEMRQRLESRA
jgi:hypothetical protein